MHGFNIGRGCIESKHAVSLDVNMDIWSGEIRVCMYEYSAGLVEKASWEAESSGDGIPGPSRSRDCFL